MTLHSWQPRRDGRHAPSAGALSAGTLRESVWAPVFYIAAVHQACYMQWPCMCAYSRGVISLALYNVQGIRRSAPAMCSPTPSLPSTLFNDAAHAPVPSCPRHTQRVLAALISSMHGHHLSISPSMQAHRGARQRMQSHHMQVRCGVVLYVPGALCAHSCRRYITYCTQAYAGHMQLQGVGCTEPAGRIRIPGMSGSG